MPRVVWKVFFAILVVSGATFHVVFAGSVANIPDLGQWEHTLISDGGAGNTVSSSETTLECSGGTIETVTDVCYMRHHEAREGADFRIRLTDLSEGLSGVMVRDSTAADAPFLFVGKRATQEGQEVVVLHRRRAGEIPVVSSFGVQAGWQWFRIVVGRSSAYAYAASSDYSTGSGRDTWSFLGCFETDLRGIDDVGGPVVTGGEATFPMTIRTLPLAWSEREARRENATAISGSWVDVLSSASVSGTYLSHQGGSGDSVDFSLTTPKPGYYRIYVHVPDPAVGELAVEVNGVAATLSPTSGAGWRSDDGSTRLFGAGEAVSVRILSSAGGPTSADAVRLVHEEPTSWDGVNWVRQGDNRTLILGTNGAVGNGLKKKKKNASDSHYNNWNGGGYGYHRFPGDFVFQFKNPDRSKHLKVGVGSSPGGANWDPSMTHRFNFNGSNQQVTPSGGGSAGPFGYSTDTWFSIERIAGYLHFRRNETLLHQSAWPVEGPLYIDSSLYHEDARFVGSRTEGARLGANQSHLDLDGDDDASIGEVGSDLLEWKVIDADPEDELQSLWDVDLDVDHDDDGLSSREEVSPPQPAPGEMSRPSTNPTAKDSEGDGLDDRLEVVELKTDPWSDDTDRDGLSDRFEYDSRAAFLHEGIWFGALGFDPTKADTDGEGVSDTTEWEILFDAISSGDPDNEILTQDDIDGTGDYDEDGVSDLHESEDRTSAVDSDDYFFPVDFSGFGDAVGVEVTLETVGEIESTKMVRNTGHVGHAGGISHHRAKDGSRVRFRFPEPSVGAAVGFGYLLAVPPADPEDQDFLDLGPQDFLTDVGDEPNYAIRIESTTPGKGRIVAGGAVLAIGDPADGVVDFDLAADDLLELRLEMTGEGGRFVVERDLETLAEHPLEPVDLEATPLVLSVVLPDESAGTLSGFANGRYRRMHDPDSDRDGLPDAWEERVVERRDGIDDIDQIDATSDSDGDGLLDGEEYELGAKGYDEDTDGDGMWDGWEKEHGLLLLVNDASGDGDEDGLSNLEEFLNHLVYDDPADPGLFSGATDPNESDSDGDGIDDWWETRANGRNPVVEESGADTIDSDGDEIPDWWEYEKGLDLTFPGDAARDDDYDNLTNLEEFAINGTPLPVWSSQEIVGGLEFFDLALQSYQDSACGEKSLNSRGQVARVKDTGYDLQLEVWDSGIWENAHWLGKSSGNDWIGCIRLNNLGMAAVVVGKRWPGGGQPYEIEIRTVDRFGILRVLGEGLGWKRVLRLEISDSGFVGGEVEFGDGTREAIRYRLGETLHLSLPDASLERFGGISESGDWTLAHVIRPFESGDSPLITAFGINGVEGNVLEMPGGSKVFGAPVAAIWDNPGGTDFALTDNGIFAIPEGANYDYSGISYFRDVVVSDANSCGDVVGWLSDPRERDIDEIGISDQGFVWKQNRTLSISNLPFDTAADHRFHAISDRGHVLASSQEWIQPTMEIDEGDGSMIVPDGPFVLRRTWYLLRPHGDADENGIADDWETFHASAAANADADGDGLDSSIEFALGLNPNSEDTDEDELKDGFEIHSGLPALVWNDPIEDLDGDGLNALAEQQVGADPRTSDTNSNGIPDSAESAPGEVEEPQPYFGWEARYAKIVWVSLHAVLPGDPDTTYFHPYGHSNDSSIPGNPDETYSTESVTEREEPYDFGELIASGNSFRASVAADYEAFGEGLFGPMQDDFNLLGYSYAVDRPFGSATPGILDAQRLDLRLVSDIPVKNQTSIITLAVTEETSTVPGNPVYKNFTAVFMFPRNSTRAEITLLPKGHTTNPTATFVSGDKTFLRAKPLLRDNFETVVRAQEFLPPVEFEDINDHADDGDDVAVVPWDTAEDIANENIAWIDAHTSDQDAAPRMPQLEFRVPGLPDGLTIEVKLDVEYTRGNGARAARNQAEDRVRIPANGDFVQVNGDTWEIYNEADWQTELTERGFFGGDAKLTYQIKSGADIVVGPEEIDFRIGGENPNDDRCKDYIESRPNAGPEGNLWFAYAIAKTESADYNNDAPDGNTRYNQFLELPGEGPGVNYQQRRTRDGGRPLWGDDGGTSPGGYGMFQVTGNATDQLADIPRKEFWNWQENVKAGIAILDSKRATAYQDMANQRQQASRALPAHTVQGVTFQDGTDRIMEAAQTMKLFNGASRSLFSNPDGGNVNGFVLDSHSSGNYCYWRTVARVRDPAEPNENNPNQGHGNVVDVNDDWGLSRLNILNFNYVDRVCQEVED